MRKINIHKYILTIFGILLSLIWISPFYIILVNSFKTKKELFINTLSLPKSLLLDNYKIAAANLNLSEAFSNSLLITILSILIIAIFSSMTAYALQRIKRRSSTLIYMIFTLAMLIPFQAVMIPLVAEFGRFHMLSKSGLIIMYLGFGSSLGVFLYYGALKGIPRSIDEAALIDGCSRFRIYWNIILPLLSPTTITLTVLDIMWIWNDYLLPSLVINKVGSRTFPLMIFYFFSQYTKQWNLGMAGLTIAIMPVLIFYFLAQRKLVTAIIAGAVKQ
ncbi:carbohydrate ABC transporter permease [Thermoanaerobacterium sp. RBIITD]|uniref:carbohydrate ABC transporter permease n=1 Tax=Thermoanaerobacterium sp. RBIITD TaxID=1550240 RepID=UPI000BB75EFB|nr:carbohydrate ABC transporter permease [Thermoanaerobacterium sp. RBIITD]SNX54816.1 raffinose/stachyose/melibiose transport system permease protein [Thermoanaerobacterium sp. RBIITD]